MNGLMQDVRFAMRQLRQSPGFAVTAILTLALGIGTTTAIFTLVYDVMLKPLPFPHAEQMVVTREAVAEFHDIYPVLPMCANHFAMWQRNAKSIQAIAVIHEEEQPLGLGDHPQEVEVARATPGIFAVLGVEPWRGRAFTEDEARPGREREMVLLHDFWRTQFDSDPQVVGRTVTLDGSPYTVIGVMPASFHLPRAQSLATSRTSFRAQPVEMIIPLALSKEDLAEVMGDFNYFGLARLKPGVSIARASAEINALQHQISASLPADEKGTLSADLVPYQDALVGSNRKPLLILLAAVAGLLMVGCINITNLMLSRAVARRHSMAVFSALGASRAELLRLTLCEGAMLAAAGGAMGVLLAAAVVPMMQRYLPPALDFRGVLHLDWAGAGCAVLLAAMATVLAGAAPTWIGLRANPVDVLRSESRQTGESRRGKRARKSLVAAETAVSVALVVMTGLLLASLMRLMQVDRGFSVNHVITAEVDLPSKSFSGTAAVSAFYKRVLDRLHELPGVSQAGLVGVLPLRGDTWVDTVRRTGDARPFMEIPVEHFRWVSPGYFEAIHQPLIAGRTLTDSDMGKPFAVISEATARTIWPGENAVGKQFSPAGRESEKPFTVIGVVRDARTISLAAPDPMMVYVPYWYRCDNGSSIVLRTGQDPAAMAGELRQAVWGVNPDASVPMVRTLDGIEADSLSSRRFEMDLLLLFAVSALLLAGLGVYGVVTYSVTQRRNEIGLRMALGAQRTNIYGLVLGEGLAPVMVGAVAGLGIAFASSQLLGSLLFEVSPYNPAIAMGAVALLGAVGAAACLLPARRAAAVEPMQALRNE